VPQFLVVDERDDPIAGACTTAAPALQQAANSSARRAAVTPTVNPVSGEGVDSGGLVKRRPPSGDLHDTGLTRTGYTGSA
jgi:hypothetical protein